jgi:Flp pilus assembly protein TadD
MRDARGSARFGWAGWRNGTQSCQTGEQTMNEPQSRIPDATEAGVMHGLGISAFRRGNVETALKFMALACALPEAPADWHRNHAEILDQCGNSEEAEAAARRALARDPNYAEAWETLGTILVRRRKHEEGCVCYQKAVEIKPEFVQALNNLAVTLNFLGRNQVAMAHYRQVSQLSPDNLEIQLNFATLLGDLDCPREGLEIVLKVANRRPNSARAHTLAKEFRRRLKRQAKSERKKNTSARCLALS